METKRNKPYLIAVAVIVVAVLLFAGGYALGMLNGQQTTSTAPAAVTSGTLSSTSLSTGFDEPSSIGVDDPLSTDAETLSVSSGLSEESSAQDARSSDSQSGIPSSIGATSTSIDKDGYYTSKDEVALYIHTYGHLPSNYISKTKAKKAGWVASKGNLAEVLPGMSIGGSQFYNDEGSLPDAAGRTWTECDINYTSGHRGAERIVFSNDGLIFYTPDHYQTFEQLY